MDDDDNIWFTICDEKNIMLEKNNNNDYKITFNIHSKKGKDTDTVLNVLKNGQLFEIKSADILQPGPAALTDGVDQLHRIILQWATKHG